MGPGYPGPNGAFARPVDVPVNALLLRGTDSTVLVDAGSGVGDPWWPGAAGLRESLARARCSPAEVDRIILTHLDFDHAGGLLAGRWPDRLEPAFPGARVSVLGEGLDWWRARDPDAPFNVGTRLLSLLAGWGALDEVDDGAEIVPGVRVLSAPGHRPGHACIAVTGRLLHLADVIHHRDHVAHPDWDPEFDADPAVARATRDRWFRHAADARLPVSHSHVAGIGRIHHDGGGFTWQPDERGDEPRRVAFAAREQRPRPRMTDQEHEERPEPDDDSDKHPLTQVENPFEDEDEKRAHGDDDAWVPPVP
jgi:glyoxylase-like metal-dependent hydrolase (beta-lactamase superfamily II)